jgi:hypothetical protein
MNHGIIMSDKQKFRTMDCIVGIALTALLAVSSWALISIVTLNERVAVIESTRFTDDDARELIQPKLDLMLLHLENLAEDIDKLEKSQ